MFGPYVALTIAATSLNAHALTPPAGWTADGPHHALRDTGNPMAGELREFNVSGAIGKPEELKMMLQVVGVKITSMNPDGTGAYGLTLADQRLGRARFKANDNGGVWMVVLATPNIAVTLDPDAVLTAAFQATPKVAGWGGQVATPMAPGGDGAPWGQPAPAPAAGATAAAAPAPQTSWVEPSKVDAGWGYASELIGTWKGMAFVNFAPTRLTFTFNGDGTVQIEKSANGRVQKHEGTWGTRGQTMRLQAPGGGDSVPFSVSGNKVGFPYEDAKVSLTKQ